jgi:hypothetical protein
MWDHIISSIVAPAAPTVLSENYLRNIWKKEMNAAIYLVIRFVVEAEKRGTSTRAPPRGGAPVTCLIAPEWVRTDRQISAVK